ncbi:protein-glucosylgalactosylhydroxylysine glucosidase-like [Littorina saxatilis]|uniref:Protein-glucosylgalactosylhydroxylysine glucosidase n=1 Tax=Littorina saxatilis TaxID=31220 RepID=A0AAN9GF78_9CAEN
MRVSVPLLLLVLFALGFTPFALGRRPDSDFSQKLREIASATRQHTSSDAWYRPESAHVDTLQQIQRRAFESYEEKRQDDSLTFEEVAVEETDVVRFQQIPDEDTSSGSLDGHQPIPIDGYIQSNTGGRVCVTGRDSRHVVVPCQAEKLGPRFLPPETSIIETKSMPLLYNLVPEISNGHVATTVQSNTIYMNGLYNGANVSSHRARIPSTAAVIAIVDVPGQSVDSTFRLDFGRGVFSEVYVGDGFNVEVRRYAHRDLTRLLVTEVVVNRTTSTLPISLFFYVNSGGSSSDIDFVEKKPGLWTGKTKTAEYPNIAGTTAVTVAYTVVPPVLTFAPSTQGTVAFFTSVSHDQGEALNYLAEGQKRLKEGTLFSSHIALWESLWEQGRLDLMGNVSMAISTNAALYYLYSALPLKPDVTWPFVGMSPGGLAHGGAGKDYNGHVFWDQDTWMFPPLALLHADFGRQIAGTRLRTHGTAKLYAKMSDLKGARYPWESAFTGLNTSPSVGTTTYELHVTSDTSWMMRQYLQLTNDTQFLARDGGYQVIADIADFWVSRSTFNSTKNMFEILGVMGPDEHHSQVNNSAFTNAGAVLSMRTAQLAARLIGQTPDPQWEKVASNMFMNYSEKYDYHPEFDNYTRGTDVKQADTVLLGFPLHWNMKESTRKNDLTYYATVTPSGPAMTWGIFAINWLRLGRNDLAEKTFYQGTWNIQEPFKVWAEDADGGGAYNFHTGMGGYLQSLLFGYVGVDLNDDHLDLNPQLPPSLTAVAVRGLDYMGSSLDIVYDDRVMNITLTKAGVPLQLSLTKDKKVVDLDFGSPVSADCQPAQIMPRHS